MNQAEDKPGSREYAGWRLFRYWSRMPEFETYLKEYTSTVTIREEQITAEDMDGYRTVDAPDRK